MTSDFLKNCNGEEIKNKILQAKNIVITAHKSPDGDAVGSTLGLWNTLNELNIKSTVIFPDPFPDFLKWMKGTDACLFYNKNKEEVENKIKTADLIFALDYNDFSRTGDMQEILKNAEATKIVIDHHPEPANYFDFILSDTKECATSQMIFQFIDFLGWKNHLTKEGAECLYCGIMTDTGSFRFDSTSAKTHLIISELIQKGVKNSYVHQSVFDNDSESRLKLLGYALSEKLKVLHDIGVAYFVLTNDELTKFNYKSGDTEGLVNYGLAVKGVNMSAIFIEKGQQVKVSFRSKGTLPVNQFSGKYFNGGGHKNAAGGSFDQSIVEAEKLFLEKIYAFIEENK